MAIEFDGLNEGDDSCGVQPGQHQIAVRTTRTFSKGAGLHDPGN
jgi:hypothetical protein